MSCSCFECPSNFVTIMIVVVKCNLLHVFDIARHDVFATKQVEG